MTEENLKAITLQEPKKVFVNMILIPSMSEIRFMLIHSPAQAVRPMRVLLDTLENQDREQLKDVMEKLESYETKPPRDRLELECIWQKISQHLHVYYLREFGIRAMNPNPKPIRSEQPEHIGVQQ